MSKSIASRRVGIPRALYFHRLGHFWCSFFRQLGHPVLVSPPSSPALLESGLRSSISELCLPVKAFLAHANWLSERVELLFVPRLISMDRDAFFCPLFLGLPDMLAAAFPRTPPILAPRIHAKRGKPFREAHVEIAERLGHRRETALHAFDAAWSDHLRWRSAQKRFVSNGRPQLLVAAHPYLLHDDCLNLDLRSRLEKLGAQVRRCDQVPEEKRELALFPLKQPIFWTSSIEVAGAALHGLRDRGVAGVILLACFGCGPDSILTSLAEHEARQPGRNPLLVHVLDEHLSAVGLQSRLEAFWDMLLVRRQIGASPCGSR